MTTEATAMKVGSPEPSSPRKAKLESPMKEEAVTAVAAAPDSPKRVSRSPSPTRNIQGKAISPKREEDASSPKRERSNSPKRGRSKSPSKTKDDNGRGTKAKEDAMEVDAPKESVSTRMSTPRAAKAASAALTPMSIRSAHKSAASRKSSMGKEKELVRKENYEIGDVVFAKVKGHPWWPAKIVEEKDVPHHWLTERKSNKEFCLMFFGTFQYGFVASENLALLHENFDRMSAQKSRAVAKAMDQARDEPELIEREVRKQLNRVEENKMRDTTDELDEEVTPSKTKKSSKRSAASTKKSASRVESPAKGAASSSSRKTRVTATEGTRKRQMSEDEGSEAVKASKRSKRSAKAEPTASEVKKISPTDSDRLMKWRHVLQKTFIRDKAVGDKPRASPETLDTVEWDAVNLSLDEFLEYITSDECNFERLYETKLHKVIKMIFHNTLAPEVEAKMEEHSVRTKINKLAEVFQKQSQLSNGSAHKSAPESQDESASKDA